MFTPAVCLTILLPLWPTAQSQLPVSNASESALQALADGDYVRAEKLLHARVAGEPQTTD